ncbi:hypothetical protein L7F22_045932 [Adiantum nelumboides]|nr:hypothetical protein [Adiantum nelumboides]
MAPKMVRKRKLTFPANVDMVSGEPRRWYIDIYDVQGNKLPRPHVLICNLEDKDSFEDVGQLWSVCMSVLDSSPDIQCLDIFVPGKLSYHLLPQAYATDCMVSNKEDTMFSRGWNIEANDAANFTCESFISIVETSMGAYFAQKQSHMVACPDDIFETWCAIIDNVEKGKLEGKRPNPTHFRCLCGLEFDEVKSIQDMLKKGKIVLSKGAGEKSKTNMPEYVMQTKQDKVIQEALALGFSAANPSKKFQDWEEIATFYGMSENIYGMLQKKCDAWVKSKLQVGKSNLEFPSDVQMYIQWIVNISVAKDITKDLPWHIPMVSLAMEDDESKSMDEDQRQIVKELEGVQDNKVKACNDLRDYQQNILGHDGKGLRGATEHQLGPMLLGTEVHEGTSSPTQPSSNLQDDESENEDEDQTNIVKGLEGVQVNKPNLYNNDDREYQQKLLINDTEGSHGATEHQLQPILLEAEVHEDASTLARQPSSSLQGLLKLMQAAPGRWKGR